MESDEKLTVSCVLLVCCSKWRGGAGQLEQPQGPWGWLKLEKYNLMGKITFFWEIDSKWNTNRDVINILFLFNSLIFICLSCLQSYHLKLKNLQRKQITYFLLESFFTNLPALGGMCRAALTQSGRTLRLHRLYPSRLLCPWGFSRQEYWGGLPCPSPGDLPDSEIEPRSAAFQADSLPSEPQESPRILEWVA